MEMRTVGSIIVSVVTIFVCLLIYTKLFGPIPFAVNSVNTNRESLFEVQGSGSAAGVPDTARLSVGVTESGPNVTDVQERLNTKAKNIIDALKREGIPEEDIKTTDYSVNPNYSFTGEQRVTGYTVTQNIEVESPIEKVNSVVDLSTRNGANLAGGIQYVLDDERREEIENEARKEAVDAAKRKAEGLAKAAGIKLGKIIDVRENPSSQPPILFDRAASNATEPAQPETEITPGESKIDITVTLVYQTL